jgi:SAM-dependent methyltransferase
VTESTVYDTIGRGYAAHRRPEPRWVATIHAALGDAHTVVNVGAGTGSYEPGDRRVVAVEPSATMIAQRSPGAAPALRAGAEALPFAAGTFDAALAVLTVHHWRDPAAGLAELQRVAARQVVVTWDPEVSNRYWLVSDYLPEVADYDATVATLATAQAHLGPCVVHPLPVPADCRDGFLGCHWRQPETYLDPEARAAISGLALLDQQTVGAAMARLADDLVTGRWHQAHADLLDRRELDVGYRLVVAPG